MRPDKNGAHTMAQQKALQSTRQKMNANKILKVLTASAVRLLTLSVRVICSYNKSCLSAKFILLYSPP